MSTAWGMIATPIPAAAHAEIAWYEASSSTRVGTISQVSSQDSRTRQ